MSLRHTAFALVAATGSLILPTNTGAQDVEEGGPYITVQHENPEAIRRQGGKSQKTVDCSTLGRMNGKLWLTCDFAEQVDSNSQEICSVTDDLPADPAGRTNAYSIAMQMALAHLAQMHGDCVYQAGLDAVRRGKDPAAYTRRQDWKERRSCSLGRAIAACEAVLDNDNP